VLELNADITEIKGAEYNPRKITDGDLEALRESIGRLGIVKPIIVRGETIVAGHQRTKSLRAIGVTRAPVFWLESDTTTYDEVRFNQLHNGTDLDIGDENARVKTPLVIGHNQVSRDDIEANFRGEGAMVRKAICELIGRYGPWGACVASPSGEIIHAAQYAIAAAASGVPIDVYVVPEESVDFARRMLSRVYGRFSYDNIERKTYVQSLAQPNRAPDESNKTMLSRLYRMGARTFLEENANCRALDFGAGRGECARQMRTAGHSVRDIEFFRRTDKNEINKAAVHRMISQAIGEVRRSGPFDLVICQAVLNSIDSLDAQDAVVGCCSLFCKIGGTLIINGRCIEEYESQLRMSKSANNGRRPEFLDENGFSAIFREGKWFFQKYYRLDQAVSLIERMGFEIEFAAIPPKMTNYWMIRAKKAKELPADDYRKYVDFEFELPWPDGSTVGMSKEVREAFSL
jgi:ParB family chromosome partitioning protein